MASEVERAIEAIVMVAEEPISPHLLAQLLEVTPARVEELCEQMAESYVAEDRGFELVRVAGGYRFQSHPDLAGYVERFALEGQSSRLSAAALETLALVAYKQPVSRAQVGEVRGVSVDGVMRTLQHRGYVTEVARDPGPGQAVLYGTTTRFLEKLGIDSLEQLPPLAQFVPGPEVIEALDAGLRHGGAKSTQDAVDTEASDQDAAYAGALPDEYEHVETARDSHPPTTDAPRFADDQVDWSDTETMQADKFNGARTPSDSGRAADDQADGVVTAQDRDDPHDNEFTEATAGDTPAPSNLRSPTVTNCTELSAPSGGGTP